MAKILKSLEWLRIALKWGRINLHIDKNFDTMEEASLKIVFI